MIVCFVGVANNLLFAGVGGGVIEMTVVLIGYVGGIDVGVW